jgi:hypothetical protein
MLDDESMPTEVEARRWQKNAKPNDRQRRANEA